MYVYIHICIFYIVLLYDIQISVQEVYSKYGGSKFLLNVGTLLQDFTVIVTQITTYWIFTAVKTSALIFYLCASVKYPQPSLISVQRLWLNCRYLSRLALLSTFWAQWNPVHKWPVYSQSVRWLAFHFLVIGQDSPHICNPLSQSHL
jgi:hypothetical protein